MPVRSPLLLLAVSLLVTATAAGMFTAVFWVLRNVVTRRPLLPPWPDRPRIVPWGGGTILLVVVTWAAVNVSVSAVYLLARSEVRIRRAGRPNFPKSPKPPKVPVAPVAVPDEPDRRFTFTEQMFLVSLMNGILLLILPPGIHSLSGARRQDLGLTSDDLGRDVRLGAIAFLAITPVVLAINAVAQLVLKPNKHPLEKMLREEMSPALVILAYLSAVVLAPAVEEILFRGVIQAWLRRLFLAGAKAGPPPLPGDDAEPVGLDAEGPVAPVKGAWPRWLPRLPGQASAPSNPFEAPTSDLSAGEQAAPEVHRDRIAYRRLAPVVVTSAIFAAVHFEQMPAPLAIFPLSIVLGLLYERTQSLVPSMVLHALFNGFNTTLLVGALVLGPEVKP